MPKGIERPIPRRESRPYVPVIRAGDWVYTAGYTGFAEDGTVPEDFSQQFALIMQKAERNLKKAGASLDRVISVTVYLTDVSYYPQLNDLFARAFAGAPPVRTCVEVSALTSPQKKIEMQFVAYVGAEGA